MAPHTVERAIFDRLSCSDMAGLLPAPKYGRAERAGYAGRNGKSMAVACSVACSDRTPARVPGTKAGYQRALSDYLRAARTSRWSLFYENRCYHRRYSRVERAADC